MVREIKYAYLNKPELEYEVAIRGVIPADNLIDLKEQIIKLSHVLSEDIKSSPISLKTDLDQARITLDYIDAKLSSNLESTNTNSFRKLETFVNHLHFRLERINAVPPFVESCSALRSRFFILQKKFEQIFLNVLERSQDVVVEVHDPPQTQRDPTLTSEFTETSRFPAPPPSPPLYFQTLVPQISQNQETSMSFSRTISGDFIKELKSFRYDGNTCPRSFLQRIEEFKISRNISDFALCKHAYEIFSGNALHWFRFHHIRNPSLTWSEIHALLIKDFGIHDYDYKLLEAIRNRTQGASETIIVYVSIMFGMFNRLSKKLSEIEQLEILLHNIRPCYSVFVALKEIDTIDSLISTCQKYEKISERDNNFREPLTGAQVPSCAAEFSYRSMTSKGSFGVNSIENTKQAHPSNQNSESNEFCFRCRITGHSLKTCTQPHYLVCFKCGRKGVKISTCPKCSFSFNQQKN